jgi:hypothetical protein
MKIKFHFKDTKPNKANDGIRSDIAYAESQIDLTEGEIAEIQEQVYYWQDVLLSLEKRGGSDEDISHAKERLQTYQNEIGQGELKANDVPVSSMMKFELEPSMMRDVVDDLRRFLRRNVPVMLLGASGFGKTEITKLAGTNIPGFPVPAENILDVRAGMMNVEDLRGIPMLEKNAEHPDRSYTKATIPAWLAEVMLKPEENFILFFDEINHASEPVLNALYGVVLERQLEGYKFGDRTRVVAAGNLSDENDSITDLSTPLKNRFEIIRINKAVENDPGYFQDFLRNKYKDSIPKEMLDVLFDSDEKLSNARAVDVMLRTWAEDMVDGETRLSPSGAIPRGLIIKLQKMYQKKYIKSTGSQRHKETINEISKFVNDLTTQSPEYFGAELLSFKVSDLLDGNLEGKPFRGSKLTLSEEGKQVIMEHFKDAPEELVVAAIDKITRG